MFEQDVEKFTLKLILDPLYALPSNLLLSPNRTDVYVEDNDGNIYIKITDILLLNSIILYLLLLENVHCG